MTVSLALTIFCVCCLATANAFSSHSKILVGGRSFSSTLNAGFGKASEKVEPSIVLTADAKCSCGSDIIYENCCKPIHENAVADPASLIRARYSAYATSNIDFVIASTSKLSSDYRSYVDTPIAPANGLKRWAKSIKANMIDEYKYVRMEVDSVNIDASGTTASVVWRHLAIRKEDNVMYPIEETSQLSLSDGRWSYVKCDVMRPNPELTQIMMNEWPAMAGLELKVDEDKMIGTGAAKSAVKRPMMDYEGSKKFKTKQSQVNTPTKKNAERSGSP